MTAGGVSRRTWTAGGAAVPAGLSAAVSAHWAAGGTWLLSTVGGAVEEQGRGGGWAVALGLALVVVLWDPWFLLWGLLLLSAALARRRLDRDVGAGRR